MTGRPRPGREAGFTIIEVLVAGMVLVVGILAVLAVFASAQRTSNTAERNEVMARQAEQQLEEMRGHCYEALAMAEAPDAPPPAEPDHPWTRLTGALLSVAAPEEGEEGEALEEELVTETAVKSDDDGCDDGDGDGEVDPVVEPSSTFTIGTGSAAVRGTVFRFVSWRDEECPVVDLARLDQLASDLQALLTSIAGPQGTLTGLVGPGGALAQAIEDATRVRDTASGGLLNLLLRSTLQQVLGAVNPLLTTALTPLNTALTPLLAPLQAALAPMQQLLDALGQRIDLCDLPKLIDLGSLETMEAALAQLAPILEALQAPVDAVGGIVASLANLNVLGLVANVGTALQIPQYTAAIVASLNQLDDTLAAIADDAANAPERLGELTDDLTEAVETLLLDPDTTHNTKRLTVAIVLEPNGGSGPGPFKPFWASSIVVDPEDALL